MDAARWLTRSLLLVAVVGLAAGCAAPDEAGRDDEDAPPVDVTPSGCIDEGQTGSGTGDPFANESCPGATP